MRRRWGGGRAHVIFGAETRRDWRARRGGGGSGEFFVNVGFSSFFSLSLEVFYVGVGGVDGADYWGGD